MTGPLPSVTVDCYTRTTTLAAPVDETVARLRAYDRTDVLDDLTIRAWPDEVSLGDQSSRHEAVARYETFREWADRRDVRIRPPFAVRERTTLVGDVAETVLVLPVLCLAIHVDGQLETVVPHETDTTTYTIEDALVDLDVLAHVQDSPAAESPPERLPSSPPLPINGEHDQCPACGDPLVNGQGLYACRTCSLTDLVAADAGIESLATIVAPTVNTDRPESGDFQAHSRTSYDGHEQEQEQDVEGFRRVRSHESSR